jgi:hypothetical protein
MWSGSAAGLRLGSVVVPHHVGAVLIFISHRVADKHIADALKTNIVSWGVDPRHVLQSPVTVDDQRVDKGITQAFVRTLAETKLFVLVYTGSEVDWSWSMWELGVASDPEGAQPGVIILQCATDAVPQLLAGFRIVRLEEGDVAQLVEDFHRKPGFLSQMPAFAPWIANEVIATRSRMLHATLDECAFSGVCVVERTQEERIPWSSGATDQVFLCHSSGDKPMVRALYERLTQDGFTSWLDEKNLLGGQRWETEIQNAIRRSAVVLICLSRASITKTGFVQKEIKIALDALDEHPEGQVYVIPIRLEACDIPDRLRALHCLDCFDDAGYVLLQRSIRGALRGDTLRRAT